MLPLSKKTTNIEHKFVCEFGARCNKLKWCYGKGILGQTQYIYLSWESNIHNAWSQHNNKYPTRVIQILRRITTLACKLYFHFFKLDSTCIPLGPIPLLCCHCRIVLRMQFIKRSETLEVPHGCIRSGYHTLILARIIYSLFMSSILKIILANNKEMFFF